MTAKSSCPNGRRLLAEWERLRAQWERPGSGSPPWKPRCGGDGVRRRPFPGMSRYGAVVRGGSRPPEEAIQETVEACPACGGPLEDRATHEQVQVRPVIPRFRTESGYCCRCRKRVRSRHPRQVSSATGVAGGKALAAVLGRNKTSRGARTHAVLASLLQTLRQPGRETLTYLISVRTAPARLPPLFPPPVWDTS
jgi:hypothetical protein